MACWIVAGLIIVEITVLYGVRIRVKFKEGYLPVVQEAPAKFFFCNNTGGLAITR